MAVIQVKKYKIIKDEKGNKKEVTKSKDEWNKETKNGTAIWYFYDRYEINGKKKPYKSKQFTLKREAETEERLFKANPIKYIKEYSKRAKNNIKTEKSLIDNKEKTLNEYFKEFLAYDSEFIKPATIYDYKNSWDNHIFEQIGNLTPMEFSLVKTQEWKEYMIKKINPITKKPYKTRTKNKALTTLSEFCKYLISKGLIKINYAKNIGNFKKSNKNKNEVKKIKYQTLEQYEFFISYVNDEFWKIFFNFAFWHGCRIGEQRALRIKDIDFENDIVYFHETFSKDENGGEMLGPIKNGKERKITLAKQSKPYLLKLINYYKQMDGYSDEWFLFGGPFNTYKNRIERKINSYYKIIIEKNPDLEINILTHHEFGRHSHASYLLNEGLKKGLHIEEIYAIIANRLGDTIEVIKSTYAHLYEVESNDKASIILN